MFLGIYDIDEYVAIPAATHRFSSGAAYQPTALTYSIYEEGGTTGLDEDVDMTPASPFDAITGAYYSRRQLTAAAGFERDKTYLVAVKATVDSVAAVELHVFQIRQKQTGDSYARLGAPAGASVSADIAALIIAGNDINNTINRTLGDHGTVSRRAAMKISAADGTAFVDFSTANVLTDYVPYKGKLTITDSAGKKLVGYIKAAGTGEVWEERITAQNDRDFSGGTIGNWQPYTSGGGSGHTVDYDSTLQALKITVGSTAGARTGASLTTEHMGTFLTGGSITVGKADMYLPSGQSFIDYFLASEGGSFADRVGCSSIPTKLASLVTVDEWQTDLITVPIYAFTDVTGALYVSWGGGVTGNVFYIKNVSFRQLVTPSTTGVTITSTPDGTTYNWASKESGFNYNDASGYSYTIETLPSSVWMHPVFGTLVSDTATAVWGSAARTLTAISDSAGVTTLLSRIGAALTITGGKVTVGTNDDKTGYSLSGSQTFNMTGNITGNLSGSVGSVSGAVGSVTGNVGGNVAGSVNSVTNGVTVTTNNDKTGYALSAAGLAAIWDRLTSALTTAGSIGKLLVDNINATIASRSTYAGGDTPGTTTLLSRIASALTISGGKVTVGTNDDKTGYSLTSGERTAIANEVEAQIIDDTDSEKVLQAIVDKIAAVNPSLGDLTLAAIASAIRTELATELGRIDAAVSTRLATSGYTAPANADIAVIKAKTDNLPASPAAVGSAMTLTSAYDAAKTAASQTSVNAIPTGTLLADDARLNNLDATVSSRLAGDDYTAPDNARIAAIRDTDVPALQSSISALDFPSVTTELENVVKGLGDVEAALLAASIPYGKVWEYTCTNSATGMPIQGVKIVASTDEAGLNAVAEGYTDAFGVARLYLVPGTYYIWRFKPGFNPVNPDVEVVT